VNSFAKRVALLEEWDNKGVKTLEDIAELIVDVWYKAEDNVIEMLNSFCNDDPECISTGGCNVYSAEIAMILEGRPTVHYIGDLNE
jgi:hypothetical protein